MNTETKEKKRYYASRQRYQRTERSIYTKLQSTTTEEEYIQLFVSYCKLIEKWRSLSRPAGINHNPDPPLRRELWYWPDFSPEYAALTREIRELQKMRSAQPERASEIGSEITALREKRMRHMTACAWQKLAGLKLEGKNPPLNP